MTSSLEGEGGGHTGRGEGGGEVADDKMPSFYWNSSQAHDFKHISRVISNLNIERAAELKKYSSAILGTLFCRGSILLTIHAYKGGGGSRKMTWWQGGGGVWIPPKSDDVIYEQPLIILEWFIIEYLKILRLYAKYTCSLNINCPGVISVVATIHLKHSTMGKEQKGNLRCFWTLQK